MKENIHNSLLEKGYSSEQISFWGFYVQNSW
jgi:hypothetical protein